jgi:hypothetical protein
MKRFLGLITLIAGIYFLFFYSKNISVGNYFKYTITTNHPELPQSFCPLYEEIIGKEKENYIIRFDNITDKGEVKSKDLKINSIIDILFPTAKLVNSGIIEYNNKKIKANIYTYNTDYISSYIVYDYKLNIPIFGKLNAKYYTGEDVYMYLDLETNAPLSEVSYFKYYAGIPLVIFGCLSMLFGFIIER